MPGLGKEIRMRRLLNKNSGRLLAVAMDHGIARGVLPGIENIEVTLASIMRGGPDAVILHKGIAEKCFHKYAGNAALILKCTSFSPYHPTYDTWVATVDEAVRLGADAISMGVIVGGDQQPEMLRNLGLISREASLAGMPLISHIYPRGEMIEEKDRYSSSNIAYSVRVAAELGVDIVKTWYTGSPETFEEVIMAAQPAKVVIAGGVKFDRVEELLYATREVIDAGAAGITYGRNVWQYKDPPGLIEALKLIIHDNGDAEAALEMLQSE